MLPDRVSNPGPLTYESGALPTALRGPAILLLWAEELQKFYEGATLIYDNTILNKTKKKFYQGAHNMPAWNK